MCLRVQIKNVSFTNKITSQSNQNKQLTFKIKMTSTTSWADTVGDEFADAPKAETEETSTVEKEETSTVEKEDKIINCCDCQSEFLFDVGTQNFFTEKNLLPPKRCSWCKQEKNSKHVVREEDPYVYFCKICKVKHEMPAHEVAYFKQNNYNMRTKCKKCKQIKK